MTWLHRINSFDIDGVIYMGPDLKGVYPGQRDIIITGRSIEEKPETMMMLGQRGIFNEVFFNPLPYDMKTRETSGIHKAYTINLYNCRDQLAKIAIHFEDDPVQAEVIRARCRGVHVVMLEHNLTEKENVRHLTF